MRTGLIILLVSLLSAVMLLQWKGDAWEQDMRELLYRLRNDSVPGYSREYLDENNIPFVVYAPLNGVHAGKQYNPTIIANYAIEDYIELLGKDSAELNRNDAAGRARFLARADWLLRHMEHEDGYAIYQFRWQQPWYDSVGVPFTSGMTSGLAIQVFTAAWRLTGEAKYQHGAKALLRGFFVPVDSGGFTYKDSDGWWYEEIADTGMHTPRILDGHIFAVTGVHEYALAAKDDSATLVVNRGVMALRNRLKYYDAGEGWSYYDAYRKPSDKKYHRLLTGQMKQLSDITGDRFFLGYYQKWKKPLGRPYVLRAFSEQNRSGMLLFAVAWALSALVCWIAWRLFKSILR